jgi:uncharacterized membrane protein
MSGSVFILTIISRPDGGSIAHVRVGGETKMPLASRKRFIRNTIAPLRLLCYVLGPFAITLLLFFRRYGHVFSIRFHAFHSMLMTAVWAGSWGTLRLVEHIAPWFTGVLAKEMRFAMSLGFLILWVWLLAAAFYGGPCIIIPFVHRLAVRLARKRSAQARLPA